MTNVAKVLVVDDSLPTCKMLVRLLQHAGFSAYCVESGADALEFLKTCEPKVVFLDVMMPVMDGFTVLQAIRANEKCHDVAVFMYSAMSDYESRTKAFELGATDYIVKGAESFDEIKRKVSQYV